VESGRLVQRACRHTHEAQSRRQHAVVRVFPAGLFGTALASTLLLGSLFMCAPAFAQSEAMELDQGNIAVVASPIDNEGDVNLAETNFVNQTNIGIVTITNTDPAIADIFAQFGLVNQSNRFESSIAISNSGDINAVLMNSVSQTNFSTVAITNTDTGLIMADIFAQFEVVNQSDRSESSIAINDSGEVDAELTNSISQTNTGSVAITNTNTAPVSLADTFTQFAEAHESNEVASSIAVENSGGINANSIGISAAITNAEITQTNAITIALDSSGDVNADSFTQFAKAHQSNEITNSIAITNTGQVKAGNIGISATITNADITQINFNTVSLESGGDVDADRSSQAAEVDQRNEITSSIAITNSGVIEGGNIGIFAQTTNQLINQINLSAAILSAPASVDVQLIDVSQTNNLVDTIAIVNSGGVFGGAFGVAAVGGIVDISNRGLVHAYAQGPSASATGIGVLAPVSTVTNRAGTIWAGISTDGGATPHRGVAIDTVSAAALIQLQGTESDGHIYGDINISGGGTIEVTQGKTWFEGNINGATGTLDVFGAGKLVLCQEGWLSSCDPNGWDNANWDPQEGADEPSVVFIDSFRVRPGGTIVYQLTSRTASGMYPQIFANTTDLSGTQEAQYSPGFYANKFGYDNVIEAGARIGTFERVEDNSLLLNTEAIYDGNNVDLSVTRTAFDKVSGLTKNQRAASGGIEHIYSKLPGTDVNPATTNSFDQMVANLFTIDNKNDYSAVLDQLTGSQFAQELQSVLWSLRPLNESITDRMDCGLKQSNIGPVVRGYDNKASGGYEPVGCFRLGQVQAWARVWGGWNNNDGDVNAPSFDERQWGIWGGADYALGDTVVLGVTGGFFRSDMDFARFGGVSGGSIEYDGGQIAGYAGWDNAIWYNRTIVSAGFYDGESHRNVTFNRPAVDPSGTPDADVVSFYNEAGRRVAVGNNVTLTPFAGVTVAHAERDGFTENDRLNTGAALKVSGSDAGSVASILGLRFNGGWGAFKPQVALGWQHEFDDTSQMVKVSFAGAPSGSNFKVIGTDLGNDTLVVDAGASYAVGPASDISVRYVGRFLDDYDAQSVMGRWTYKFGAPVGAPPPPIMNPPLK
jgi:uncharacterized protein with beta-barrel porin domain